MSIKSYDFTKEIKRQLQEYTREVIADINERAKVITKRGVKELKQISPKRPKGGDYAKSWTYKEKVFGNAPTRFTVHNKDHYRLTHLLEHGHAIEGGSKRTKAQPHIKEVEEKMVNEYIEATKEVIKNGRL